MGGQGLGTRDWGRGMGLSPEFVDHIPQSAAQYHQHNPNRHQAFCLMKPDQNANRCENKKCDRDPL